MVNNRPTQLEAKRKEHYDKLYARQPQLMNRLKPLMKKAEIIQDNTEPFFHSLSDPLNEKISEEPNVSDRRLKLHQDLNKFSNDLKKSNKVNNLKVQKITDIAPKVLWGLK